MTETKQVKTDWTPAELAAEIARIIRTKPERWGQGSWFRAPDGELGGGILVELLRESLEPEHACGSTACVAGWAAILASPAGSKVVSDFRIYIPGEGTRDIEYVGRDALGLESCDSYWLFSASRSENEVLRALDSLARGEFMDDTNDPEDYEDEEVEEDADE